MRPLASVVAVAAVLLAAGCTLGPTSGPVSDKISHVGQANHDLVSARAYPKLFVEIDSPPGYGPDSAALDTYKSNLEQATGRDASAITIDASDTSIPAEPSHAYTLREIEDLESAHRSHHTGGDTAALYILYVAGSYEGDTSNGKVLGVTYRGTSIAMFKGNIQASSASGPLSGAPPLTCVEQSVITHESGHAMGLVNLGTAMQSPHEDSAHPGHSSNQNSVMYWAVESSAGIANLFNNLVGGSCSQTGIPYAYDSNDLADLKALGSS